MKTPLRIAVTPQFHDSDGLTHTVVDADGIRITHDERYYPEAPSPEQMRRIVACVNACAGIDTDELEGGKFLWQRDDVFTLTPRPHT